MLEEVKEGENRGKLQIGIPVCKNCNKPMSGFFWKFYKNPTFTQTEVGASFLFTDIWFQCVRCPTGNEKLTRDELDKINALPLDMILFPEGIKEEHIKYQRLGNK